METVDNLHLTPAEDLQENSLLEPSTLEEELTAPEEEGTYKSMSVDELAKAYKALLQVADPIAAFREAQKIKSVLNALLENEKDNALQKYLSEGGVEDDFKYRYSPEIADLDKVYKTLKGRYKDLLSDITKQRAENLRIKKDLLEQLRAIVESNNLSKLKEIQQEWKKTGPVPAEDSQNLWASYNALLDRFYDNRSIGFELKDLDRKKNLEAKLELCVKVEKLADEPLVSKAVNELTALHKEYKHIGPVPVEQKEAVWLRFKAASDAVYARKDAHIAELRAQQQQILTQKQDLLTLLQPFAEYQGTSSDEWKKKGNELETLQKKWTEAGFVGKENQKELNKQYWHTIKQFYTHKNEFHKSAYDILLDNYAKKVALCEKAEALSNAEVSDTTTQEIIKLQKQWKDIGHVPFKKREEVYNRFKAACDTYFGKKRENLEEQEAEYEVNLQRKLDICSKLENLSPTSSDSKAAFRSLHSEWKEAGYVPRKNVKEITERFSKAVQNYLSQSQEDEAEKRRLKISMELEDIRHRPDAKQLLFKKEQTIKFRIKNLTAEIDTLTNNLLFFARSKNAGELQKEVNQKVKGIEKQIEALNDELSMLYTS